VQRCVRRQKSNRPQVSLTPLEWKGNARSWTTTMAAANANGT
jgi:hypothetical protein